MGREIEKRGERIFLSATAEISVKFHILARRAALSRCVVARSRARAHRRNKSQPRLSSTRATSMITGPTSVKLISDFVKATTSSGGSDRAAAPRRMQRRCTFVTETKARRAVSCIGADSAQHSVQLPAIYLRCVRAGAACEVIRRMKVT